MTGRPALPLGWIVPDGTNRTLEETRDKKVSSGFSLGGGQAGAVMMNLQRLEPYYGTPFFMVDLETGEVFGYIQQQWRRAGLYCSNQPFTVKELMHKVERNRQAMGAELEAEQHRTPLMDVRRTLSQFEVPPPLPVMDNPDVYVLHPDTMETNTRKNYVCDRMRAALIYILEYAETQQMLTENRYRNEDLMICLRAVFGRVNRICEQIDKALLKDDEYRRKTDMQFLLLPTRFPSRESIRQGDITVWTNWICEETEVIMNQLEEEMVARGNPDDPFNGSANGIYEPLQESFSLPPPVQTPRREDDTKYRDASRNLQENEQKTDTRVMNTNQTVKKPQMQAEPRESREHSRELLDLIKSIRTLHNQQLQNQNRRTQSDGALRGTSNGPQEHNLITFTPPPQETTGRQNEPKKQRSPKKRRPRNDWQPSQGQFE